MKTEVVVFKGVTSCFDVVGYHSEDGGSIVLQKVGILLHYYTAS
jgi:hypothetical protein